jgi:hypothetical protein
MRLTTAGNLGIGTTSPQARLDVRAQGALSTDIAFRVRNSADTADLLSVNGAGGIGLFGLTSINGAGVANTALAIYGNGNGGGNFLFRMYDASAVERIQLTASGNLRLDGATDNGASGDDNKVRMFFNFSPTSGTRSHTGITLGQTINQTGGANGVTRGLFISPTLTSAADFRAIETTVGNVILGSTSGNVGIGTTSPTKKLQLNVSASDDGILLSKAGSANSLFRVTMDGTNDRGEMFLNNGATIVMAIRQASNPSYINTGNNFGIGTSNPQARLDVRAQGALSTDIAFRVRNSADTQNFLVVNGAGDVFNNGANGGDTNTHFGFNTARNRTGNFNTTVGNQAGRDLTTGATNALFGYNAGRNITTQSGNTFIGTSAGQLSIVNGNTAIGSNALLFNTTGAGITAVGSEALYSNTTGPLNTALGNGAGLSNTTGGRNTFLGNLSGRANTAGQSNIYIGVNSGFSQTTGNNNFFAGEGSGMYLADGVTNLTVANNSIFLGRDTRANANNQTNQIVIGDSAIGLGSNTVVLGNTSITRTALRGQTSVNTDTVNASAQLQIDSTTRGFLPPRMTNAQRLAIASPAIGLMVYCTDATEGLYINKSTGWTFII